MQKQIIKLTIAFLFVITLIGASSATNSVNSTDTQYIVGQQVTQQALANTQLNLQSSDRNLLITTAGTAQLNEQTTENSVQAIVDTTNSLSHGQNITYGSGNLLTINEPNGPLEYTFVSLTGSTLMAKKYSVSQTGTISSSSTVNIGTSQSNAQFQAAISALGSNGFDLANIANLWAAGAPADLLAETYTTGSINPGTIANYAMTRTFALTYPSGSNYVITNAGGSDDDALMYGPFGFNEILFSTSSGTPGETAFINYKTINNARSGVLTLMKQNDLTSQFGNPVVAGTISEIQYNLYLLSTLKTNAASLFTVEALKSVNEADITYLWYDDSIGYGHGIDKSYIAGLSDASITWNTAVVPITDYGTMFSLGQQAFQNALSSGLFTANDLAAGNVAVVLAPYYVNLLNKYSLVGFIDGIVSAGQVALANAHLSALGFTIDNILQIRNPWTWGSNTGSSMVAVFLKTDATSASNYLNTHEITSLMISAVKITTSLNTTTGNFAATTTPITDVSPSSIAASGKVNSIFIPAVAGIGYAWAANAPYNYVRTIGRVGCICSTKEYDLSSYLQGQYPLLGFDQYLLFALTSAGETNRQISGRTAGLGVSPSQGTYYAMQGSDSAYPIILIVWNGVTNTGKAMLIQYSDAAITNAMKTEYAAFAQENSLFWHLDQVWNENGQNKGILASVITVAKAVTIDQNFLNYLTAAGGDPIQKMLAYVEPVTPVTPATPTATTTQGTSVNGFANIGGAISGALNGLGTSNGVTNEIAPGLPLEQAAPTSTSASTSSNGANLPIGIILGVIFLIIAGILVYLGKDTIVATLQGYGRPGK